MLLIQPSSCCDICMEEYYSDTSDRSPHSIGCGHIFCGLCILNFDPKQCPMCRASFRRSTRLRAEAGSSSASPTAPQSHDTECNMCSSSICGVRYKCLECPDYDTCAACFDLTLENHPGHSFVIIHDPLDLIKRSQRAVEHNDKCSNCKQRVFSVHYQCTECPDYDLCASCEALPIPVHSPAHPMVKIKSPNSAAYALTLRARVPGPIINSVADINSPPDLLSQPIQVLRARFSGPIINSAAVMHSSSDFLSQPMQARRRLLRLLEDDTIIPSQPMQAESSRMGQEQSLPRAQMNAQFPMPPPHEMGLWEMKLEQRSPHTYTVCGRVRVDSETRLRNPLEGQLPRLIIVKGRAKFPDR